MTASPQFAIGMAAVFTFLAWLGVETIREIWRRRAELLCCYGPILVYSGVALATIATVGSAIMAMLSFVAFIVLA